MSEESKQASKHKSQAAGGKGKSKERRRCKAHPKVVCLAMNSVFKCEHG